MRKKIIFADFAEYNDGSNKLGNFHYCNCFVNDGYEALWMTNSYNPLTYFRDKDSYYFRKSISKPGRHEIASNVYGFAAFTLRLYGNYPLSRNPNITLHNEKYIVPDANDSFRRMDFGEVDILWISNPKFYWLTNVVKYNRLIYRIADDYSCYKEYPNISVVENRLIDKADFVFVTAEKLAEKAARRGKTPYLLNNGALFEHFAQKISEVPLELRETKRKKVVYVGAMKYWLDVKLIKRIALETDADIFLVGKPETDLTEIRSLSNVHVLGAKSFEDVPDYLKNCDVAIIPFVKSALTDSVNPIKLYEYCSAGIAVVCTDMEEVRNLNAPIHIAKDHDDFVDGVNRYLREGYDERPLIDFGRNNSWAKRYETMRGYIDGDFVRKPVAQGNEAL